MDESLVELGVETPAVAVPERVVIGADHLVAAFLESCTPATLQAYGADLADFARFRDATSPAAAMRQLLADGLGAANLAVLSYRNDLVQRGLAAATVNRRLAAIRSCVRLARVLGMVPWSIDVRGLKVQPYRDTRGPGREGVAAVLAAAESARDCAIVRLLYDLALRRVEVRRLDVADVDLRARRLAVRGKGRTEKEWVSLPAETASVLQNWLDQRGRRPGPLTIALDRGHHGARLSGVSIYKIVRRLGEQVSVHARPHGLRHAAITDALEATNGNIRSVARFSRHADIRTVERYDDARRDLAGEISAQVAGRLAAGK